ncbi:MAG: hypothetical protein RLZZ230_107 [Candidatus Parcubacteria bacterium]|jgi:hypothetical protein
MSIVFFDFRLGCRIIASRRGCWMFFGEVNGEAREDALGYKVNRVAREDALGYKVNRVAREDALGYVASHICC